MPQLKQHEKREDWEIVILGVTLLLFIVFLFSQCNDKVPHAAFLFPH